MINENIQIYKTQSHQNYY